MGREEIITIIKTLISDNLELKLPEQLKESDRVFEDLGVNSVMILQLVLYIEEAFKISIPEDEIYPERFQTVGSIVNFIGNLMTPK
jgi:aryl carrier protein AsbD